MKVVVNAPAKINLVLNVVGKNDGYHELDMLMTTISIYDRISITERNDGQINLKVEGYGYEYNVPKQDDNIYKSAKLYMETYQTSGVDITVKKMIPLSSGLGGSSADIAGVLRGMEKIFKQGADVKSLADKLGSDSGYLTIGGYARIKGRGEIVEPIKLDRQYHLVIVVASGGVSTKECFEEFDKTNKTQFSGNVEKVINSIKTDSEKLEGVGNALYGVASELNTEIKRAYEEIEKLSPKCTCMSGSGSAVYGIYQTEELAKWAKDKLKYKFDNVVYCKTMNLEEVEKIII